MRKRILCLFVFFILIIPAASHAAEEQSAQYKAYVHIKCNIRREADTASYRIRTMQEKDLVEILSYAEDWCLVRYKGDTGYLKTEWLCQFRSLDPYQYPVPGYTQQAGLARLTADLFFASDTYDGNTGKEGALFTLQQCADGYGIAAVARSTMQIPDLYYIFQPFTPWEDAKEGDLLYAFTTYFNDHFAKKYNEERIYNIELGCERIDGITVAPGETFSFNALCYPYRKSNGYQMAPNISKAGYGYGGGVCQVSTTLYNCILGLPLQVTKWAVHRDRGISYAPQYFDSAVGDYSDLAFINTLPYSIVIHALPQDGVLTTYITAGEGAASREDGEESSELLPMPESTWPRMQIIDADSTAVALLDTPDGSELLSLPNTITVNVIEKDDVWSLVSIRDHQGYVRTSVLCNVEDARKTTVTTAYKLRLTPDTEADSVYRIAKGGKVTVLNTGKEWAYITADGYNGYILKKYLK